jgi:hypothetical protein
MFKLIDIPISVYNVIRYEPPYEINGSGIPIIGTNDRFINML